MTFKSMDQINSNEDMSIQYDLADRLTPIMVESDGWMSLEDAQQMYEELGIAINAVTARWRK